MSFIINNVDGFLRITGRKYSPWAARGRQKPNPEMTFRGVGLHPGLDIMIPGSLGQCCWSLGQKQASPAVAKEMRSELVVGLAQSLEFYYMAFISILTRSEIYLSSWRN